MRPCCSPICHLPVVLGLLLLCPRFSCAAGHGGTHLSEVGAPWDESVPHATRVLAISSLTNALRGFYPPRGLLDLAVETLPATEERITIAITGGNAEHFPYRNAQTAPSRQTQRCKESVDLMWILNCGTWYFEVREHEKRTTLLRWINGDEARQIAAALHATDLALQGVTNEASS